MRSGARLVMAYRRLADTTVTWPAIKDGLMTVNHVRFEALFSGLDWRKVQALTARRSTALLMHVNMRCKAMGKVKQAGLCTGVQAPKVIASGHADPC